jgi:hypothetical protein
MEIAALVEVGTMFCNCKECKKTAVTEKIQSYMYYIRQNAATYLSFQFGATSCCIIDYRQCLNFSWNTGISAGNMLWAAVNTKSLRGTWGQCPVHM